MILPRNMACGKILFAARLIFFTGCMALLTQCGRDNTGSGPKATTVEAPKSASLMPKAEAAAVRVIVTVGSTIQKDYGGVLLNREALTPSIGPDSTHRMAAVIVPDFDEKDLLDKACTIRVRRNKINEQSGKYSTTTRGMLVHFDAETHLAMIVWTEKFPASLDMGLMPVHDSSSLFVLAIRADGNNPVESPTPIAGPQRPMPPGMPPQLAARYAQPPQYSRMGPTTYAALESSLYPASLEGTKLVSPAPEMAGAAPGNTLPVLGADGGLAGFGSRTKEGWAFRPFVPPKVDDPEAYFIPQLLTFTRGGESKFYAKLDGEWHDSLGEMTRRVVVQHLESPDAFVPAVHPEKNQLPLSRTDETFTNESGNKFFTFPIRFPNASGTLHDLVQLQLLGWDGSVKFSSAPVLVSLETRGSSVYPEVRGLAAPTGGPADVAHKFKDLTTESRILYGVPMREGRELLFKLDGAPFWKRLSLEKGEWLPLPKEDLTTAVLAGNKEAIFLAQPATRQIRRYNAQTLAEEKSALLPADITCRDIVTGCLAAHAPVAIVCQTGVLACDPHDLACSVRTIANGPGGSMNPDNSRFIVSGDGGSLKTFVLDRQRMARNDVTYAYQYRGRMFGVGAAEYNTHMGSAMTVSAPYIFNEQSTLPAQFPGPGGEKRQMAPGPFLDRESSYLQGGVGTFANSPVCFRVIHGDWGPIPPVPARCGLQGYFSPEPFLSFNLMEQADIQPGEMRFLSDHVWFEPSSMSIAVWHGNRMVSVRNFDKSKIPVPNFPALLNFPETIVPRGGQFEFSPMIFGPPGSKLKVTNPPLGWQTDAQGVMKWRVPPEFLAGECTLQMELISGKPEARPAAFTVTLKLDGVPPAAAVPAQMDAVAAEDAIRKIAFGAKPTAPIIPMPSRFFKSDRPISKVLPGLKDYLLLTQDDAVALFSLKEWKITGNLRISKTTLVFPVQDSLLTYDSASRSLCRQSLPDLSVAARFALPGRARLLALGAGEAPDSPVALILETPESSGTPGFNEGGRPARSVTLTLLDRETLNPSKWAPFTPQKAAKAAGSTNGFPDTDILSSLNLQSAVRVPVSRDGRILFLPGGEILMSPTLTTDHRTPGAFTSSSSRHGGSLSVISSAANKLCSDGQITIGGGTLAASDSDRQVAVSRSAACVSLVSNNQNMSFGVIESLEGRRPLLNVMNLEMLKMPEQTGSNPGKQMSVLGDQGLLTLLNKSGTLMQVISFDLPKLLKKASPASVLVTSRAPLFVTQGQKLEYQVTVNNPDAVRGYRIRDNVIGASIDEQGHFVYAAPPEIHEDMLVNLAIDVLLKNDEVVLHEFPICVVPFQLPK
jgi:hypothetical protein